MTTSAATLTPEQLLAARRSRRHPRLTQHDYLHVRRVLEGLRQALAEVPEPVRDVLDVWCGSRPYDDLLPAGARIVGLDVPGNPYGVADVVSPELLPFADASFDLVLLVQSLQYMPDVEHAVAELRRVLRPGGTAIVTGVCGYAYDRESFEARYTEHQLRALFDGWERVRVRQDGGAAVTWTTLSGTFVRSAEQRLLRRRWLRPLRPLLAGSVVLLNLVGLFLERAARREARMTLPMNLTLTARRPPDA